MYVHTGKLLYIKTETVGIAGKPFENLKNVNIEPGIYLILDEVVDNDTKSIFIEILCSGKIVLLRFINSTNSVIL